jgi:hypothetical protein
MDRIYKLIPIPAKPRKAVRSIPGELERAFKRCGLHSLKPLSSKAVIGFDKQGRFRAKDYLFVGAKTGGK